jgi:hypothetical protein
MFVVVVFENEQAQFVGEVAFVRGPFTTWEAATDWAETARCCADGKFQITTLDTD